MKLVFRWDTDSSDIQRPWWYESDFETPLPDLGILQPRKLGEDKGKEAVVNKAHSSPSIPTTFGVSNFEDKWIKRGIEMLPPEKKAIFLEKWKKMEIHELELFDERSRLIQELENIMLDARKSK